MAMPRLTPRDASNACPGFVRISDKRPRSGRIPDKIVSPSLSPDRVATSSSELRSLLVVSLPPRLLSGPAPGRVGHPHHRDPRAARHGGCEIGESISAKNLVGSRPGLLEEAAELLGGCDPLAMRSSRTRTSPRSTLVSSDHRMSVWRRCHPCAA